jgi:parvulin-like peptidyl-prolyl isomerase
VKARLVKRPAILITVLALICAGICLAVVARASTARADKQETLVNGQPIPSQVYGLYLEYAQSQAQAESPSKDATAAAQRSALESAEQYMVQLQQGQRLGVISAGSIPFAGGNMARLRVNTSGYGTSQLSDKEVVDQFLANVEDAIVSKTMPESSSAVESALQAQYQQHKASYQEIQEMTVRRIRLPYAKADKAAMLKLAAKLRGEALAGADFAGLAAKWDHAYYSDPSYQSKDGAFTLTGQEMFADPTLLQIADALPSGQISQVVDGGGAYYVVKMVAKQAVQLTFAQVKDEIYYTYTKQRYTAMLGQWTAAAKVRVVQ